MVMMLKVDGCPLAVGACKARDCLLTHLFLPRLTSNIILILKIFQGKVIIFVVILIHAFITGPST